MKVTDHDIKHLIANRHKISKRILIEKFGIYLNQRLVFTDLEIVKKPKAEYSNRSPFGIARPGINR